MTCHFHRPIGVKVFKLFSCSSFYFNKCLLCVSAERLARYIKACDYTRRIYTTYINWQQ